MFNLHKAAPAHNWNGSQERRPDLPSFEDSGAIALAGAYQMQNRPYSGGLLLISKKRGSSLHLGKWCVCIRNNSRKNKDDHSSSGNAFSKHTLSAFHAGSSRYKRKHLKALEALEPVLEPPRNQFDRKRPRFFWKVKPASPKPLSPKQSACRPSNAVSRFSAELMHTPMYKKRFIRCLTARTRPLTCCARLLTCYRT